MTFRPSFCLIFLGLATALGLTAGGPVHADRALFEAEAPFGRPITVRVTGMPLDQLLSRLSAELGVSLQPAASDIGDVRVSVFAEGLPARQVLSALTSMLNLAPEGGFGWSRSRSAYQLHRSQQARLRTAERLRQDEAALATAFRNQLRDLKNDPERLKQWADPSPVPRLQRASMLLASLSDDQIDRLQRDGVLVLRQPDASPEHQRIIGRLVSDLVGSIDSFLRDHPEEAPRYQNIDPAATSVLIELHRQVPSQSVVVRLNLGPDKGGSRNSVWSSPLTAGADPGPTAASPPGSEKNGGQRIALSPRSWSMAEVLSDLARRSRIALVSDCYTVSWSDLQALPPLPLDAILDQISRRREMRWERKEGIILLRSRVAHARQAAEVPQRLIDRWLGQIERDRAVGLETLHELCLLSDAQLFHLRDQWEIGRLIPNLNFLAWSVKYPIRLYGLLSPAQRAQVARGGLRLSYGELSPLQQQQFAFWAKVREPDLPDTEYEAGAIQMRLTDESCWQVTLSLGGRASTESSWLGIGRNWNTGAPQPVPAAPWAAELIGHPAPPLHVRTLDGKPHVLPAGKGRPFLLHFREVWVVPYVGSPSDAADLEALAALLQRRPELRAQAAVICPRETASTLKQWVVDHGRGLPAYADEQGSVVEAFGRGALTRLVLIAADGRIQSVRSGYPEALGADWDALVR